MLRENFILKDKNYILLVLFIFVILSFQNWYFGSLTSQNQELININKEVLSSYKELIDNHLKYSEDVHYMRITAENLEKQNKELMEKTERLNELFFDQMY
ncbi:hypothetical protein KQI88_00370 [Alkaliphilus sp. MSJ-5]|uniref:Rod shape-determining protein MreC n=1 Tax=Alkaliphilus flagellatus TaxID=2841507 RepID=A0ABS6FXQ4_9FIRM|nr:MULTISPECIES: hypothetical protein [Alkaliphilus]MBU5674868.1 hypothetical protein [Alkaliphilus flagellatus]QUH18844.1 hypothetical protein HYG84_02230 [Alkaliphilus sp. B6464]